MMNDQAPRQTGGHATITEYYASDGPRIRHVRKFEIRGPYQPSHDDLDMHEAEELFIYYIKPRKRTYETPIRLLHGTAYASWAKQPRLCYDNNHYVLIEHNGKVLFDSRDVFPCDMQEFNKKREDYVAQMAARGFHRAVLDHLKFGNEGARQCGRAQLPAMSEQYIDEVCAEIARVLRPSGYLMYWTDTFRLCEGHHLHIPLKAVDLIAWDSLRLGMGKRSRRRGDYLVVLQKPPIKAGSTWCDHGIPSRWPEKVDRKIHPHIKPIGLLTRLIAATTQIGDTVVDPAAGSFVVKFAATRIARNFVGCDLVETDLSRLDKFTAQNEAWHQFSNEVLARDAPHGIVCRLNSIPAPELYRQDLE